jgi:galactokinase/mevalonate kinase-like predicted kinase
MPGKTDRSGSFWMHSEEKYTHIGVPGGGIGDSSVCHALHAAATLCQKRQKLDRQVIAAMALADERKDAGGRFLAADDVLPIVFGGAGEVFTYVDGSYTHNPVELDPEYIHEHFIFAFNPTGQRHDVAQLLQSLYSHPRAGDFVRSISDLALEASHAAQNKQSELLVNAMQNYVDQFQEWTGDRMILPIVKEIADRLRAELGSGFWGWKPPGGGAAESLLAAVETGAARLTIQRLHQWGWKAMRVNTSPGFYYIVSRGGRRIRLSAPHRIDVVGGADLGQDPEIGVDGVCFSIAIEPRCTLDLTFAEPRFGPDIAACGYC